MAGLDVDSDDNVAPVPLEAFPGAVDSERGADVVADDADAFGSGRNGIGRLGVFTLRLSIGLLFVRASSEVAASSFIA